MDKIETPRDDITAILVNQSLKENRNVVRDNAYAPYSNFRVGAAIRTTTGEIFVGCNVENVAYGPSICAERVAISTAVAAGFKEFDVIAISSDVMDPPTTPCGVCRQFMREFSKDLKILVVKPDGTFCRTDLSALLPESFGPGSLKRDCDQTN